MHTLLVQLDNVSSHFNFGAMWLYRRKLEEDLTILPYHNKNNLLSGIDDAKEQINKWADLNGWKSDWNIIFVVDLAQNQIWQSENYFSMIHRTITVVNKHIVEKLKYPPFNTSFLFLQKDYDTKKEFYTEIQIADYLPNKKLEYKAIVKQLFDDYNSSQTFNEDAFNKLSTLLCNPIEQLSSNRKYKNVRLYNENDFKYFRKNWVNKWEQTINLESFEKSFESTVRDTLGLNSISIENKFQIIRFCGDANEKAIRSTYYKLLVSFLTNLLSGNNSIIQELEKNKIYNSFLKINKNKLGQLTNSFKEVLNQHLNKVNDRLANFDNNSSISLNIMDVKSSRINVETIECKIKRLSAPFFKNIVWQKKWSGWRDDVKQRLKELADAYAKLIRSEINESRSKKSGFTTVDLSLSEIKARKLKFKSQLNESKISIQNYLGFDEIYNQFMNDFKKQESIVIGEYNLLMHLGYFVLVAALSVLTLLVTFSTGIGLGMSKLYSMVTLLVLFSLSLTYLIFWKRNKLNLALKSASQMVTRGKNAFLKHTENQINYYKDVETIYRSKENIKNLEKAENIALEEQKYLTYHQESLSNHCKNLEELSYIFNRSTTQDDEKLNTINVADLILDEKKQAKKNKVYDPLNIIEVKNGEVEIENKRLQVSNEILQVIDSVIFTTGKLNDIR